MTTKNVEIDLEEECCGICRFHSKNMECRRTAPKSGSYGSAHTWTMKYDRWPFTKKEEWCGEFEKEVL